MMLLDFLIRLFGLKWKNNFFIKSLKLDSVFRVTIKGFCNFIIPFYFKYSNSNNNINDFSERKVIVSFTTFPGRINSIWLVVECMLRQKFKPDKIILWLSINQFPSKEHLPLQLLEYENKGLEIHLCQGDLRSHKKYYYALKQFPNDLLITIDDDFFYPSNLISDLMELHKKYPKAICCERGHLMKVSKDILFPYNNWEYLNSGRGPSFDIFQTSGGGTLYPPSSLHPEVFNKEFFLEHCKTADDVWLNMMSQLNSTKIIKSNNHFEPIPIFIKSDFKLSAINVSDNQNDVQIKKVRDFVISKFKKDPFCNFVSK
jgi:hypothetical protein